MYKILPTDLFAVHENSEGFFQPILTMENEYGEKCQVYQNNKCYVVAIKKNRGYRDILTIFPEALKALQNLPPL